MTNYEATNSVFNITEENNCFSISTPSYWSQDDAEEIFNELNNLIELRSENDIELRVKEAEKSSTRREIENSGYNLVSFDHFKSVILAELKRVKCKISKTWFID